MDDSTRNIPEIKAELVIAGTEFDPLRFSRATGLLPTSHTVVGGPRPDGRGLYPLSSWAQTITHHGYDIDPAVTAILDLIWPARGTITSYFHSYEGTPAIWCTVTTYGEHPALELSPETLKRLAVTGLRFGLRIYDYS